MKLVQYFPTLSRPTFNRDAWWDDRWFDHFLNGTATAADWAPSADVVERENAYEVSVELPGVEKDAVKVSVENGLLTIGGEKAAEKREEKAGYSRTERRYGSFSRSFELPDGVDAAKIDAKFKNGVLTLSVPKAPEILPRKIEIKE